MIFNSRVFLLLTFSVALGLSVYSTQAEARSFWQVFFGHEEKQSGPPPEETLQAPFGKVTKSTAKHSALEDIYGRSPEQKSTEDVKDMAQPNVSAIVAAAWASEAVTEALTINPDTFEKSSQKLSKKFLPYAIQEYNTYLQNANLLTTLKQNDMMVQAMSTNPGILGREGSLAGTYHWVVRVPILITYYPKDTKTITRSSNAQSQKLSVEVQIGRAVPEKGTDNGIRIEHWRVSEEQ